jgi:uncharacterized DUF497 family protein
VVVIAFDPIKRKKNLAKHGLDLADAGSVFAALGWIRAIATARTGISPSAGWRGGLW